MTHPLSQYLPHDEPMILIDELVSLEAESLSCKVTLSEDSPFYDPDSGRVPEWVGMEYMAQTVATLAGVEARGRGEEVRIGFLLGTRKYQVHERAFALNTPYTIRVERLYQDEDGMANFQCDIFRGQAPVASARINVFQPNNVNEYLGFPS
ncbi:hotdog family protein [Ferrimonas futtsuensis]|uniref:ApeP family dehydratase n=1 Tax=Ferrimonas futtsuensis TaxID=364764 RepID=UPI0003F86895|nr:hotdog family protein [Ferrimonas futtsuensis]